MRTSGPRTTGISLEARALRNRHAGAIVWLTGLPAAGKSTLARALEQALFDRGIQVYALDGDDLRRGLSSDLGFSREDRTENVRRAGEVARMLASAGMVVIAALVSPFRRDRERARHAVAPIPFLEVFVDCPVEECVRRDPKGLYARAGAGEVAELTGLTSPYEIPERPDVHLRTDQTSVAGCVEAILRGLPSGTFNNTTASSV